MLLGHLRSPIPITLGDSMVGDTDWLHYLKHALNRISPALLRRQNLNAIRDSDESLDVVPRQDSQTEVTIVDSRDTKL